VNVHAHLLDYALSFYSLHIFSTDTYVAEITYLSFGRHWCEEKKEKKKKKEEGKSYLLRCCKYISEVHTEGNHEVGFELDDEKVCEI
jgi:5-methylthioribose kinase